eukprot:362829-Hanusia_phi.AAC.1
MDAIHDRSWTSLCRRPYQRSGQLQSGLPSTLNLVRDKLAESAVATETTRLQHRKLYPNGRSGS